MTSSEARTTIQEPDSPADFRNGTVVLGLEDPADAPDTVHATDHLPVSSKAEENTEDSIGTTDDAETSTPLHTSTEEELLEDANESEVLYEYDVYARETMVNSDETQETDALETDSLEQSDLVSSDFAAVDSEPLEDSELSDLDASLTSEDRTDHGSSMPEVPMVEDDDSDSEPDTPAPPPVPQPSPRRRSTNPLVLASVLVVTLGAIGSLIGYSLFSYFSNGGSILDPGIAPTPTMPEGSNGNNEPDTDTSDGDGVSDADTASVDADALLLEAEEKAESARTLAQTAQSGDDWDLVARQWQRAIALTEQIPASDGQYTTAQQRLTDYQTNFATAQQQAEDRANVASAPLPSTVVTVTDEAQIQCLNVAATADSQAVELTNVRFDTPSDDGATNQIVGCITNHSDQAIASATIDYTGSSADDPEAVVEGRGELDFTNLDPGATVAFRGNFELPASLNAIEISGITWLPSGSTESQSIETSLALTNTQ